MTPRQENRAKILELLRDAHSLLYEANKLAETWASKRVEGIIGTATTRVKSLVEEFESKEKSNDTK